MSDLENREMIDPLGVGNCDALNVEVSSMRIVQTIEKVSNGGHTTDSTSHRCLIAKHLKVNVGASLVIIVNVWVMSSP